MIREIEVSMAIIDWPKMFNQLLINSTDTV